VGCGHQRAGPCLVGSPTVTTVSLTGSEELTKMHHERQISELRMEP
jgi:hypothetical protein